MNGSGDPSRRGRRRQGESLGGSLDQWVTAGRQLVDGVAGSRPGSRPPSRSAGGRPVERPSLEGLGRWVENRLDWFLEEEDDWSEPWQEQRRPPEPSPRSRRSETGPPPPQASGGRRPLEAISRRTAPLLPPSRQAPAERIPREQASPDEWPDDDSFSLPRWQRQEPDRVRPQERQVPAAEPGVPRRPLPRSSRRRG